MSTDNRYSLRSYAYDLGTVSSRTRSRSSDVNLVSGIESPVRKRGKRVKTEPVADSVKIEHEQTCSSKVHRTSVQTIEIEEPLVQFKIEPLEEPSCSLSTKTLNRSNVVPKIEYPASPVPSSRSTSSPIFLRAKSPASPTLTSASSLSSLLSDESLTSLSSTSSCSSFHLYSSSSSPPRDNDSMNYYYAPPPPPPPPPVNVPTAKVWDCHNGYFFVRELQLAAPVQQSVRTYPKKTYYKKPYKPYWKKNNNRNDGRSDYTRDCNCRQCRNQNSVATLKPKPIAANQNVNKPMNIECNITINAPSTCQSSAFIKELFDQQPNSLKTPTQAHAPGLAPVFKSSINTPMIIPVPVPVPVPESSFSYQPNTQISYNYMGHNITCSTSFC